MNEKTIALMYKMIQLTEAGHDPYTSELVLMEDRMDFVKNKYRGKLSTEHDKSVGDLKTNSDDIIDHLAGVDPSPKKIYTDWLTKHYQGGKFQQEDAYKVGEDLDKFHKHKARLEVKDINQHTPESLNSAVAGLAGKPATRKEMEKETDEKGRTHVWGDDKLNIFRLENSPEGKAASISHYSGGHNAGGHHTSWCTTVDSDNNMFDHYSKNSPLYVIHEKGMGDAPNKDKVYQFHVHSNQFMDAADNEIGKDDWERIAPSMHKAFSDKPELLSDKPMEKKGVSESTEDDSSINLAKEAMALLSEDQVKALREHLHQI
jgi:hypothetical protein